MYEKFKDINEAKEYLRSILVDAFVDNIDNMPEDYVMNLANANWEMGLREGDITYLEI